MMKVVTYLVLISQISCAFTVNLPIGACVANTQFALNGRICYCDQFGRWSEANCLAVGRRTNCLAGQIVRQGCSQCVCQETGHLLCSNSGCDDDRSGVISLQKSSDSSLAIDASKTRCTPFKSYYINCSICVCPATGITSEAHCAVDNSCQWNAPTSSDFLLSVNKNFCIPKVMYLFPCLHCLCSDGGYFELDKCLETCHRTKPTETARRCLSGTFYRKNCNICWCPDNSIADDKLCTKNHCKKNSKFQSLNSLKAIQSKCHPYSFIKPKCYYCICNTKGYINENACLELECLKINEFKYDVAKSTCSPGEMLAICMECFCLRDGTTSNKYCSNSCSYESKINILERVLSDNTTKRLLIERASLQKYSESEKCEPNSIYLDAGRYCLCPDNGSTNFKLCTSVKDESVHTMPRKNATRTSVVSQMNQTCKPNSFVEIDCNTCYCAKNGIIDPKWCTFDDCHAKRIIQEKHRPVSDTMLPVLTNNNTCVPGSISKTGCNFCICPESGMLKDKACTKNKCSEVQETITDDKHICEPLNYYLVDCNVCFCPQDGIKNVAKCTKKICEKTILRSESCVPGEFFSDECNVCVCPPNGDKADKVCTNHRCSQSETPWKRIFKLSQKLVDNSLSHGTNRQLDVCFSGEEFEVGCKICICPDVGLRSYATCISTGCEEKKTADSSLISPDRLPDLEEESSEVGHVRSKRSDQKSSCMSFNITDSSEKKECTPGSMYIIRCRQCICPYVGNINRFCRPMPDDSYCEQAYPNFNYIPMGRRNDNTNATSLNTTTPAPPSTPHPHTVFSCARAGRIADACFVCECEETLRLVEEHCFRNDAEGCGDARPSFLDDENKTVTI